MSDTQDLESRLPAVYTGKMYYNKIQQYSEESGVSIKEICEKLGWHQQQFYAMNNARRKVKVSTLIRTIERLGLDPEWLTTGIDPLHVEVIKKFPEDVLKWLITDEGREAIMEAYGRSLYKKTQQELNVTAKAVYEA